MRGNLSVAGVVALLSVAAAVPLALAGPPSGDRQSLEFQYTSQQPGSSTGTRTVIDYFNPNDPDAKPYGVDAVILAGHPGSQIDTSVPARCSASDAELIAEGQSACPRGSIVGGGVIKTDSGIPGPLRFLVNDVTLINNRNELIFLIEERRSGFRVVTRSQVRDDEIRTRAPFIPGGPPDGQLAIDFVNLKTKSISNARGNYITTPATCPSGRQWTNRGTFKYDDNQDSSFDVVQTETSRTPCTRGGSGGGTSGREVRGTSDDDVLTGTDGNDRIFCGAGDDRVHAGGGNDVVRCGSGNDVVRGGAGSDRLFGESGDDDLFGDGGNDLLVGGTGNDRLVGGPGTDQLSEGTGDDSSTQ